jgi:hypothetical protein
MKSDYFSVGVECYCLLGRSSTLDMKQVRTPETLMDMYQTTRRHNPEDIISMIQSLEFE